MHKNKRSCSSYLQLTLLSAVDCVGCRNQDRIFARPAKRRWRNVVGEIVKQETNVGCRVLLKACTFLCISCLLLSFSTKVIFLISFFNFIFVNVQSTILYWDVPVNLRKICRLSCNKTIVL